jgi:NAD(P)-dependent dehydrogenase (short-subunit alcohol dehydrogenase family)
MQTKSEETMQARGIARIDPKRQFFEESLGLAPNRGRLAGRAILVLGGGQRATQEMEVDAPTGNGRAICLLGAREGARIACADMDREAAQGTVDLVAQEGGVAVPIVADAADPIQVERTVLDAAAQLGHLDGLVLNVGIGGPAGMQNQTADAWDHVFAVNLRSHMLACRAAMLLLRPGSSIVFISSTASIRPGTQIPSYDASKAALAALCRHVAMEGEALGIRANVLAPGPIDTPLGRAASRNRPARAAQRLPFGREGTSWEVAHAALFLLSHESSFINAQVIVADGGITALQLR